MAGEITVNRAWMRALRDGPLCSVYVFFGEERYRIGVAVQMLKDRLTPPGSWDLSEFEARGVKAQDIAEAAMTPPLAAERRLILVHGIDPVKADLSVVLDAAADTVCLVFIVDDPAWKPDRRVKQFKRLAQTGEVASFQQASPEELSGFIRRLFSDRDRQIGREETEYLIFLCTPLMGPLKNEIEKVAAFAKDRTITRADIDAVASRAPEAQIFTMCDELIAGRTGRALLMLEDLRTLREAPIAIASVIARQYRQLYAARLMLDRGGSLRDVMSLTGQRYEYHARRLTDTARQARLDTLRRAALLCAAADGALKSSRAEPFEVLRMLMLRLSERAA